MTHSVAPEDVYSPNDDSRKALDAKNAAAIKKSKAKARKATKSKKVRHTEEGPDMHQLTAVNSESTSRKTRRLRHRIKKLMTHCTIKTTRQNMERTQHARYP